MEVDQKVKVTKQEALQTLRMYSTLKQRGNERFHVVSMWNTRGVFVGRVSSRARNTTKFK